MSALRTSIALALLAAACARSEHAAPPGPPDITISAHPESTTADKGTKAVFTVVATGDADLAYQWRKNGVPVALDATGARLVIASAAPGDAGDYDVVLSNGKGSVVSQAAHLTVQFAPVVDAQPSAQSVVSGGTAVFAIEASGVPAPSYQWRKDGQDLPGQTGATLTISAAAASDAGSYDVVVTNALGSARSVPVALAVGKARRP